MANRTTQQILASIGTRLDRLLGAFAAMPQRQQPAQHGAPPAAPVGQAGHAILMGLIQHQSRGRMQPAQPPSAAYLMALQRRIAALPGGGHEAGQALQGEISGALHAGTLARALRGSPSALASLQEAQRDREREAREHARAERERASREAGAGRIEQIKTGLLGGGRNIARGLLNPGGVGEGREFGAMGDVAQGFGQIASLFGPAGRVVGAVASVAGAFARTVETIHHWNDTLRQSDRQMAQFSPGMARTVVEQEVRDMLYLRDRGNARADTARERNESFSRMREGFAPLIDRWNRGVDRIATAFNNALDFSEAGERRFREFYRRAMGLPPDPADAAAAAAEARARANTGTQGDFFQEVANRHWSETYGERGMPYYGEAARR